jgi:predicted phage terminase large subunit-like protein
LFPDTEFGDVQRVEEFETTKGGGCKFVGAGGPVTGFGADGIVIDDPHKSRKEAESELERNNVWDWYNDDILSRVEGIGFILVMATRWHADDLIGRILAEDVENEWTVLNFPAIYDVDDPDANPYDPRQLGDPLWPERYRSYNEYYEGEPVPVIPKHAKLTATLVTREEIAQRYIAKMKRLEEKNAYGFAALYQGRPRPKDGGLVKPGSIREYTGDPEERAQFCDDLLISVDANFKVTKTSDFASIQVLGRTRKPNAFYLIEEIHDRLSYPQLKAAVTQLHFKYPRARLLIEAKANGQALIEDLRAAGIAVVDFDPGKHGSKETRAQVAADHINGGAFFVPSPKHKANVSVYIEDVEGFGFRPHDDRMDGFSQACIHWSGAMTALDHMKRVLGMLKGD